MARERPWSLGARWEIRFSFFAAERTGTGAPHRNEMRKGYSEGAPAALQSQRGQRRGPCFFRFRRDSGMLHISELRATLSFLFTSAFSSTSTS